MKVTNQFAPPDCLSATPNWAPNRDLLVHRVLEVVVQYTFVVVQMNQRGSGVQELVHPEFHPCLSGAQSLHRVNSRRHPIDELLLEAVEESLAGQSRS